MLKTKVKIKKYKKPKDTKLTKQVDDLTEKWKRALADYHNLEKRIKQERQSFIKFSNSSLIDKLLSVVDSLEKTQDHLKDKGLDLAIDQFKSILTSEGVEEIKALKQKFNPETMDCAEVVNGPENIITEVLQKGYYLNGKILRPAKVKVGKDQKKGKK